jgi:Raf kinase inhibitor-like YbhB/YbcL family protein
VAVRSSGRLAAAVVASIAVTFTACSSEDGRTLPVPDPGSTTSTSAPTLDSTPASNAATEVFTLFSTAFTEGGPIPERSTCDGEDLSPPLDWVGVPAAAELAIVVRDLDAEGFVHWVLNGIDPSVRGLGEGGIPESAVEAQNGFGTLGWAGPCPPQGEGPHTYQLVLHALPEPLVMAPGTPAEEAADLVEGVSSAQAALTATAARDLG